MARRPDARSRVEHERRSRVNRVVLTAEHEDVAARAGRDPGVESWPGHRWPRLPAGSRGSAGGRQAGGQHPRQDQGRPHGSHRAPPPHSQSSVRAAVGPVPGVIPVVRGVDQTPPVRRAACESSGIAGFAGVGSPHARRRRLHRQRDGAATARHRSLVRAGDPRPCDGARGRLADPAGRRQAPDDPRRIRAPIRRGRVRRRVDRGAVGGTAPGHRDQGGAGVRQRAAQADRAWRGRHPGRHQPSRRVPALGRGRRARPEPLRGDVAGGPRRAGRGRRTAGERGALGGALDLARVGARRSAVRGRLRRRHPPAGRHAGGLCGGQDRRRPGPWRPCAADPGAGGAGRRQPLA